MIGVLDKAETPTKPGPVVHGFVVGGGGDGDAVRGVGLRRAFLPDRPGQRHRQPDHPGDQALAPTRAPCARCREHIDYDCSGLLQREKNLDQTGDELIEVMLRTCNGRLTAAEALGHREFVLTRLYESA